MSEEEVLAQAIMFKAVDLCPVGIDAASLNSFLQAALGMSHQEAGAVIRRGMDRGTIRLGHGLRFFAAAHP